MSTHTPDSQRAAVAQNAQAVESEVVGYGYYQVPIGYSIWAPVFKNVSGEKFDLNQITPATTNCVTITGDGKILIFKLSTTGTYGTTYGWYPTKCGGWSGDYGTTKVADGVVTFSDGEGFAMSNSLKCEPTTGAESTKRSARAAAATMLTSGKVDLVCKNEVPVGYSISANATPNTIKLSQITPATTNLVNVTGDGKILVFKLGTDGKYGTTYGWYPTKCGGWSGDYGTTKIDDDAVTFAPGEGWAMSNSLKCEPTTGAESTKRSARAAAAVMQLPSPL